MWLYFALFAAFSSALYSVLAKKLAPELDHRLLAATMLFVGGLLSLAFSLARGFPTVSQDFFPVLAVATVFEVAAMALYFKSLESTDVSLAIPLLSLTPVLLLLTSSVLVKEFPNATGVTGVLLVVAGGYLLLSEEAGGALHPLKSVFKNKGVACMLVVAVLYSFTGNFNKLLVKGSDAFFACAVLLLSMSACFAAASLALLASANQAAETKKADGKLRKRFLEVTAIAVFLALTQLFLNAALLEAMVSYVYSVKRTSILLSVVLGAIALKEKRFKQRFAAAAIIVAGVALIAFS